MPTLKQGDTTPEFQETLTDEQGEQIDLSESDSVRFYMEAPTSQNGEQGDLIVNASMSVDYTTSEVTYDFQQGDTSRLGEHLAEVVVTFADGEVRTFPDDGYFTVTISEPTNRDVPPEELDSPDITVGVVTADQVDATTAVLQEASVASAPAAAEDVTRQADLDGHAGETDVHHTRYTDTDAQEALSGHTSDSSAHHPQTQSSDIDHANVSNVQPAQHHAKTTSGDIDHAQISNVQSGQHHPKTERYTAEEVRSTVVGFLAAAGSVGLTHDDADDTLTVSADENTDTQLTDEQVQDIVGAFVTGGSNVSVSYDDTNNTLTIDATDTNTQLSTQDVIDAVGGEAINPDTIGASTPASSINTEQTYIGDNWSINENSDGDLVLRIPNSGQIEARISAPTDGSAPARLTTGIVEADRATMDQISVDNRGAFPYMSSDQTLSSDSFFRIQFDSAVLNHDNEWDTANYTFSPTTDGYYWIASTLGTATVPADTEVALRTNINGGNGNTNYTTAPTQNAETVTTMRTEYLEPDDTLTVLALQNSGADQTIDNRRTKLAIRRL